MSWVEYRGNSRKGVLFIKAYNNPCGEYIQFISQWLPGFKGIYMQNTAPVPFKKLIQKADLSTGCNTSWNPWPHGNVKNGYKRYERERNSKRNYTKSKKKRKNIDLFSESLLARANNLSVPPSHTAEALASREIKKERCWHHKYQREVPCIRPNEYACHNNLCCPRFSKHSRVPRGVIVILTHWDKRLNENTLNRTGRDLPCLGLCLIKVITALFLNSRHKGRVVGLLCWSNYFLVLDELQPYHNNNSSAYTCFQ